MTTRTQFFLNRKNTIVKYETIEISHPNMSKTYRIVRNARNGLVATLETSATVTFDYYPILIDEDGESDDLDNKITISFGDLGTIFPAEIDLIKNASGFGTKPTLKYRVYSSADLSAPLYGPLVYEINKIDNNGLGASFEAIAPSLNVNVTGEIYTITRFPGLAAFK